MKKWLVLCCILILSLFAVGCEKTIDLTDEESQLIAEYAAELLIKYDRNLHPKYDDSDIIASPDDATSEVTTEAATELTTENEAEAEEATKQDATTEDHISTSQQVQTVEDIEGVVADSDSSFDIASFLGEKNISITYMHHMLLDTYPSYDRDGVYIEIEAPSGYKLLVLKFGIENRTNETQMIDLYEKDAKYNIILNNKKSARQMLTILMDDMYTYQKKLDGSMREEAVLLYQISDNLADSIDDLKLKITYDGNEHIMQLQD